MFPTIAIDDATLTHTTHLENLTAILRDGAVRCPNTRSVDHREIFSAEIVQRRAKQVVNEASGLMLGGCVALTMTAKTPAHFAIATGHGVTRVPNGEIVHLETSIVTLANHLIGFAIADRNPLARDARFHTGIAGLAHVDWDVIASGKFAKTAEDPGRVTRASAEALIRDLLPISVVRSIICWDNVTARAVESNLIEVGRKIPVRVRPEHFFSAGA